MTPAAACVSPLAVVRVLGRDRDLVPADLRAEASIFRDAIAVLDAIGRLAGEQESDPRAGRRDGGPSRTARARTGRCRDVGVTNPDEIARIDQRVREARLTVDGLWQILHAPKPAASA
jgi:hypothetical protein